ncbi:MAG: hypothetical protein ACE5K0_01175 [Candidatus Methanofastidiosia archaeon]
MSGEKRISKRRLKYLVLIIALGAFLSSSYFAFKLWEEKRWVEMQKIEVLKVVHSHIQAFNERDAEKYYSYISEKSKEKIKLQDIEDMLERAEQNGAIIEFSGISEFKIEEILGEKIATVVGETILNLNGEIRTQPFFGKFRLEKGEWKFIDPFAEPEMYVP